VYLSGYDHDIFVSYAHEEQLGQWTERLREELGKALNLILFLKPPDPLVDVWIDEQLRKNLPLDDELRRRVEKSALLLVVMSPFYMRSEWCGNEVRWFAAAAAQARAAADGRVFVVQAFPTDRGKWPETIARLPGYCFFARHPVAQHELPVGLIGDKEDEVAFKQALYNLAGQIKSQLDELKRSRPPAQDPNPPPPARPSPPTRAGTTAPSRLVCLETLGEAASAGADAAENDIRRLLEQHDVTILAPGDLGGAPSDPVGAERYLQRLTKAKAGCGGLILLRRDPTLPVADWVLDYICDIRPTARRLRADRADPRPLIIDAGPGDPAPAPKEIPVLRYGDAQFETQLGDWIGSLAATRQEARA
jgi:hypothetical protein